ncbi:MAG: glycosyltransferase family 4 protein [Chloroflexi bacterium]|nr:glycosyltransferase family 4 protein [Chloroflexota bacterium]
MNIAIDASRAASGQRTGVEGYSYHLLRHLLAIATPHRLTLYCNQSLPPEVLSTGPSARLRSIPQPRLWTQTRLAAALLHDRPDVLFVPAHVLPVLRVCRGVVTVHDLGHLDYRFAYPPARWWYLHLGTWYSVRAASRVIADSQTTRDDLVRRLGVAPARIDVVSLGYDPAFRPLAGAEVAPVIARYGLDRPYFLAVGTIQPRKNYRRLLEAFARLDETDRRRHRLVIAGKPGYGADDVYRAATALGLGDAVRFLGYTPEADLPALLNGAVALVFPSLYEGFGLPTLEAMACGTPVVASRAGSLPEVVGEAGLLVDPTGPENIAGALARLIAQPSLRADLRERGLVRSQQFSWARCAAETLSAIERAVK